MNGEINSFSNFTPTIGEVSSYDNNKDIYVRSETIGKSFNHIVELF